MVPPPSSRAPSTAVIKPLPAARARLAQRLLSSPQAYLWGLGLGSFALGLVNGALVISSGIGVLAYRQLRQLSPAQQQALRQRLQSAVPLPRTLGQQALVLSVMLGASTYTVTALWQSTHSLLMALVLTGQTALTFFIVVALLRSPADPRPHPTKRADADRVPANQGTQRQEPLIADHTAPTLDIPAAQPSPMVAPSPADRFEQALAHLTEADPLQRLIAVRQLVRLAHNTPAEDRYIAAAEVSIQAHLIDCFHLMLAHEPEPIVRSAVREGLTLLRQFSPPPPLPVGSPPLPDLAPVAIPDPWGEESAPLSAPPPVAPTGRRTVEYVEYLDI